MYIKMYVTEEEKKQLEQIAQRRKVPLSKLCYEQVIPLLHNTMRDSTIYLPDQTDWEKCTYSVTLHLSDSEYDTLTKKANGSPLSRYIRSVLLYHSEPIHIEVYTEDISILTMQVSGYIQKLYSFIAALAIRQQLYEADYNHLLQIANDTQKALRSFSIHCIPTQKRGQPHYSDTHCPRYYSSKIHPIFTCPSY